VLRPGVLLEAAEAVGDAQPEAEVALRGAVGGGEGALGVEGGVAPPSRGHQHAAAAVEGGRAAGGVLRQGARQRGRRLQQPRSPLARHSISARLLMC